MSTSGELKLTTEKVLVFKNGDCLIIKKGVGTSRNNTYWTEDVPQNTILGSVWVDPKDGKLISFDAGVQTTKEKSKERVLCTDFFQLLDSNKGSKCTVLLPKDKVISGTIREALVNNIDEEKTDKPVQTSGLPDLSRSYRSEAIKGNLFVISNDQGDHIVRIDQVQQLILPQNSKLYTKKIITKTTKRLTFRFEPKEEDKQEKDQKNNENSEKDQKKTTTDSELSIDEKEKSDKQDEKKGELITRELIIVYFVVGVIRWIPTYRIQVAPKSEQMEITEDKKTPKQILDLSCQAEIINAGESLVDAYLELVVGVPSFKFRDTISPFSLEPTIKNLLNEKIPQIMGVSRAQTNRYNRGYDYQQFDNRFSNAIMTQQVVQLPHSNQIQEIEDNINEDIIEDSDQIKTTKIEDLFTYHIPKLSLHTDHRAGVSLLSGMNLPYKDIYVLDYHVQTDCSALSSMHYTQPDPTVTKNPVWHKYEITNTSTIPFTTGPVMIFQKEKPLAQSMITYTPPKQKVRVDVTIAVDIQPKKINVQEVGRKLKHYRKDSYDYALISNKAQLGISNFAGKDVTFELTLVVGGKVTKSNENGQITVAGFRSDDWISGYRADFNNSSTILWCVVLKKGETKNFEFDYEYFIRH